MPVIGGICLQEEKMKEENPLPIPFKLFSLLSNNEMVVQKAIRLLRILHLIFTP